MRAIVLFLAAATITGCASSGAVPSPFPTPTNPSARVSPPTPSPVHAGREGVVGTALSLRGSPYRDGGADPSGFDCSGLVAYVFGRHGTVVPRTVSEQYRLGSKIARNSLGPGDLVFFRTRARGASHVGIAVSEDEFVHAPTESGVVRVESLSTPYWSSRFVGARRLR